VRRAAKGPPAAFIELAVTELPNGNSRRNVERFAAAPPPPVSQRYLPITGGAHQTLLHPASSGRPPARLSEPKATRHSGGGLFAGVVIVGSAIVGLTAPTLVGWVHPPATAQPVAPKISSAPATPVPTIRVRASSTATHHEQVSIHTPASACKGAACATTTPTAPKPSQTTTMPTATCTAVPTHSPEGALSWIIHELTGQPTDPPTGSSTCVNPPVTPTTP
jgi:hypothetical protein